MPPSRLFSVLLTLQVEYHSRDEEVIKAHKSLVARYAKAAMESTMSPDEMEEVDNPFPGVMRAPALGSIGTVTEGGGQ